MFLRMNNITKMYGTLKANDDVSLYLKKGEILAIAGENGAGKSTIMKILYGLEKPTSGEILLNDEPISLKSPLDAIAHKIGMVQQHFMLFPPYTVAENIIYAKEPTKHKIFMDMDKARSDIRELSQKYGLEIDPDAIVEDCPVGLQQRIEILKVLYQDAELLIFDEPSAVLTPQEVGELLQTLRNLRDKGKSIILITHKLQEVMDVADRVMIMRSGKYIKDMPVKETSIEEMSFLMVGHRLPTRQVSAPKTGNTVLDVKDLKLTLDDGNQILKGLSIHVKEGEVVGIAGVSGNGQTDLVRCLTGLSGYDSGSIEINGSDIKGNDVAKIRNLGMACIPEDRFLDGCAKEGTLTETMLMAHHKKKEHSRYGIFRLKENEKWINEQLTDFDVKYTSQKQKAKELSGGNLQKLIAAREIAHNSKLLIAVEPTRGVDIGAMSFIHDKLMEKREKGDGILLISSELTEILELSDRIYVIYNGKIAGEFTREQADTKEIGFLMLGGKKNG